MWPGAASFSLSTGNRRGIRPLRYTYRIVWLPCVGRAVMLNWPHGPTSDGAVIPTVRFGEAHAENSPGRRLAARKPHEPSGIEIRSEVAAAFSRG